MNKILYISSEIHPLIKTGGLGDVSGSLPVALSKKNQDVRLLMPAYPDVLNKIKTSNSTSSFKSVQLKMCKIIFLIV